MVPTEYTVVAVVLIVEILLPDQAAYLPKILNRYFSRNALFIHVLYDVLPNRVCPQLYKVAMDSIGCDPANGASFVI